VRLILRVAASIAYTRGTSVREGVRWFAPLIVFFVSCQLVACRIPLRISLAVQDARLRSVAALVEGDGKARQFMWMGIHRGSVYPGAWGNEIWFEVSDAGFLDIAGLALLPNGPSPNDFNARYEHITGEWFVFRSD
jgi:hypothetical protein